MPDTSSQRLLLDCLALKFFYLHTNLELLFLCFSVCHWTRAERHMFSGIIVCALAASCSHWRFFARALLLCLLFGACCHPVSLVDGPLSLPKRCNIKPTTRVDRRSCASKMQQCTRYRGCATLLNIFITFLSCLSIDSYVASLAPLLSSYQLSGLGHTAIHRHPKYGSCRAMHQ